MAGAEATLETLILRGWSFKDPDQAGNIVQIKADSAPGIGINDLLEVVESELLNMDLRSMGGKSLPDTVNLKKLSHLQGPKVLQVVSTRDVYQSSIDASIQNSQRSSRLLRFVLTDGNSETTAIEYTPIPFISEDIIPGSKVRLENKITIHNGILCLNPKVVTVLGGVVESLYEEWQLQQKYSSISRSISRPLNNSDGAGPPPFEKLQLGKQSFHLPQQHNSCSSFSAQLVSKSSMQQNSNDRPEERNQRHCREQRDEPTSNAVHDISSTASTTKEVDSSTSSSKGRAREVIEVMPIQNQAAAQKLLQKMVQPRQGKWPPRGQRHRVNVDDNPVFTLEEWENRKAGASKHAPAGEMVDVSRDEEIARQLQMQLDLEDFHVQEGNGNKVEAERIKMSMFNFQHGEERCDGRRESRGRGRGRGRRRFG